MLAAYLFIGFIFAVMVARDQYENGTFGPDDIVLHVVWSLMAGALWPAVAIIAFLRWALLATRP